MKVEINRRRFLIFWFIAGALVLPMSAALSTLGIAAFYDVIYRVSGVSGYGILSDFNLLAAAFFGLVSGLYIGIFQSIIVRRALGLRMAGWWKVSAFGGLLAGVITWTIAEPNTLPELARSLGVPWFALDFSVIALDALVFLTVLSSIQASVLRKYSSGIWRWIAAHLGAIALVIVFLVVAFASQGRPYADLALVFLSLSPVTAAITGVAMYRMLLPSLRRDKVKRDDGDKQPVQPSVWDDAI